QAALLDAIFSQTERLIVVLDALEARTFSASLLTAIQKTALLEHPNARIRRRAKALITSPGNISSDLLASYVAALSQPRDLDRGRQLFTKNCATCHQAHGVGTDVGPNLTAENMRAEETMLQDILSPSSTITAGYGTYMVSTNGGQIITGLLA